MGCQKLLNNSKLFAIASGIKHQPLAIAYKRENKLSEKSTSHGNTFSMPHSGIKWDFADRLRQADNGTLTSYYNYDSSGERSRKVVDKGNIIEMRFYLGGYEVFRKYVNGSLDTERTSLHVMDDTKTVALVEKDTLQSTVTVRYQYDNHLGSACLELDASANIISYEEYHPFGTTSYRSGRTETEVSLKRYKYVGKERDEETGLYYYGARYYAAWLCRFVSVDPLQHEYPQLTPFNYAGNKPITHIDIDGMQGTGDEERKTYTGKDIPKNSIDNDTYDTYFNSDGTINKVISGGTGKAFLIDKNKEGIITTTLLSLTNKEIINRAHWVFGEGGGNFIERYAMTIENLKQSGKSGYGPKAFKSEYAMYIKTMKHGTPPKTLFPNYFTGKYKGFNPLKFADARKDYAVLSKNENKDMILSIKAVLDSITGKLTNEGYNNWRGSGDTLYTQKEKDSFKQEITYIDVKYGKRVKYIKTVVDHFFEKVGSQYRRHSFKKITLVNEKK